MCCVLRFRENLSLFFCPCLSLSSLCYLRFLFGIVNLFFMNKILFRSQTITKCMMLAHWYLNSRCCTGLALRLFKLMFFVPAFHVETRFWWSHNDLLSGWLRKYAKYCVVDACPVYIHRFVLLGEIHTFSCSTSRGDTTHIIYSSSTNPCLPY